MRDPLHWLDVKRKLALTFVGVCVIAFGVGGSLAANSASSALEEEILVRLRYQCRAWADALDGDLRLLTRRCEDFASDGYIRESVAAVERGGPDAARVRDDLRRHLARNKLPLVADFAELAVLDETGAVLTTATGPAPFAALVAGGARSAATGPWHSGFLGRDEATAAPLQAIAVPLRALDGTREIGRLVAWVRTDRWISSALHAVEQGEPRREETLDLALADAAGREIEIPRVALGREVVVLPETIAFRNAGAAPRDDGSSTRGSISVHLPLAANGWTVRARLNAPEALAPVAGLQARFLLVGIALAAGIGMLLFFPMQFLARPLVRLREAARRLEAGDLAVRVASDTGDEIGDLARSFNHMAEAVETRTHRMEESARELAAQRDRLNAVIANLRDGLVVLDGDGRPAFGNAAGKPMLDLLAAKDPRLIPHYQCDDARDAASCASCLFDPRRSPRSCVVDVGGRVLEIHATPLPPGQDGRRGRVLLARDITDRVAQDERQIHQERLSVLGEVAAVMAHEINNPLAAIRMFAQMTDQGLGPASPYHEHLGVIRRNTDQCERAIRELLDYATGAPPEIGESDLHAIVEDAARFVRPVADRAGVRIEQRFEATDATLSGDEVQLRQVFVNLLMNALQAMSGPDRERTRGEIVLATRDDGAHVVVDVIDDGPGIPADVAGRIFEPFFTTKRRGFGTGLGLPTARRIAELHGGGLELAESRPGRTVFRIRLRRAIVENAVPAGGGAV
jgi:signal transduction histidine kinase